jgi:hypothetical protein
MYDEAWTSRDWNCVCLRCFMKWRGKRPLQGRIHLTARRPAGWQRTLPSARNAQCPFYQSRDPGTHILTRTEISTEKTFLECNKLITVLYKFINHYQRTNFCSAVLTGNRMYSLCILLTNSVALVRERTIPTERPPFVGEVSANFCG